MTNLNISMEMVEKLAIHNRSDGEIVCHCPVCNCTDAWMNTVKRVWRCWHCPYSGLILGEVDDENKFEIDEPEEYNIEGIREIYNSLADIYYKNITHAARNYLYGRGLTEMTIEKFKLGFCSSKLHSEYSLPDAQSSGIVLGGNYPQLLNRITIPYIADGTVTDIRGRIFGAYQEAEPKAAPYKSLVGNYKQRGALHFLNHDIIKNNSTVIVTEGEFKAIVADQYGFPVVATAGITRWDDSWTELLKDKEVILMADRENVTYRRVPAFNQASMLIGKIPNLKVGLMDKMSSKKKVDIDTFILERGIKSFSYAIKAALDVDEYLWLERRKGFGKRNG